MRKIFQTFAIVIFGQSKISRILEAFWNTVFQRKLKYIMKTVFQIKYICSIKKQEYVEGM